MSEDNKATSSKLEETEHSDRLVPAEDFDNPQYYQNRELSWLDFNARVIAEAEDENNPLPEQLTFLAIGSTNLDEFVRVRVAGLQDQVKFGSNEADTKKQWSAKKQLAEIAKKNEENINYQYRLYNQKIEEVEEVYGYAHRRAEDLTPSQKEEVEHIFEKEILPAITPYGIDAYRPFPNLENEAIHLFCRLTKDGDPFIAIIPIPRILDRYYILEEENKKIIVLIEEVIKHNVDSLFKGYQVDYVFNFRISRNADAKIHEEGAEDLLSVIENYLERRENGAAVRLEIDNRGASPEVVADVAFLIEELSLSEQDVTAVDGPLALEYLWELRSDIIEDYPGSGYPAFKPYYPVELCNQNIFDVLDSREEILLHHPFDSFDPVVELVAEAAGDSDTVSIKQTLYRVSKDSPLIAHLKRAAKNGIQVTVLVELKARFDEHNNVVWANELEEAGVHVLYGVKDLKTHSKATLVVKKKGGGYRRYVHLGTGNYNDKTALQYTDLGYITTHESITEDVFNFFNYLSGYSERPDYNHLHVSPNELRSTFIEKIENEIQNQKKYQNSHIVAKMNSLTDKTYIQKLYEASQAGVKIELIIRGICCLIPGIPGLSENIKVRSLVGRFLEHTRIYYFNNNDQPKLYLSSADMMTRNLSRRVEIAFPIHQNEEFIGRIIDILKLYLADNCKAWELQNNEQYVKVQPEPGEEAVGAQKILLERTARKKEAEPESVKKNWFEKLTDKILGKNKY